MDRKEDTLWTTSSFTLASLSTCEERAFVRDQKQRLVVGIPKEYSLEESRLCLTPSAVALLTAAGHQVRIEKGAGQAAKYQDVLYEQAGAELRVNAEEVFKADIVLKVEPPTAQEIACMNMRSTLISALQVGYQDTKYISALNEKHVTALAFEWLRDENGEHTIQRAMAELAGSLVPFIAAEYLSTSSRGIGVVLGSVPGVPPNRIVLLGSGTVAEHAARVMIGLGAEVHIFDSSIHRLRHIRRVLGQPVFTSTMDHDTLQLSLQQADVLIGAVRPNPAGKRFFVTEHMVQQMKEGAVIIDVSIDQGGCIDTSECTTHGFPVFYKHGVTHYCVPNITSRAARTATMVLSNILTPLLMELGEVGGLHQLMKKRGPAFLGVYTHRGYLTNIDLAKRFNMEYKALDLLI